MKTMLFARLGKRSFPTLVVGAIGLFYSSVVLAQNSSALKTAANGTTMVMARVDTESLGLPSILVDAIEENPAFSLLASKIASSAKEVKASMQGRECFYAIDLPSAPHWFRSRLVAPSDLSIDNIRRAAKVFGQDVNLASNATGESFKAYHLVIDKEDSSDRRVEMVTTDEFLASWEAAFATTKDFPLQMCIVAPEYFKETIAELEPELPEYVGGGAASPLVSETNWLSLGLNPVDMTLRVVISTTSEGNAKKVKDRVPKIVKSIVRSYDFDEASSAMALGAVGLLQPKIEQNQVIYAAEDPAMTGSWLRLGIAALAATSEPLTQVESSRKLKQHLLGMHNYESAFGTLPTYKDIRKEEKRSGLSWRVHILPFLEGGVELYQKFKLDEPWDSDHNKKLLSEMPDLYKPVLPLGSSEVVAPYHTTFVSPFGEDTIFGQDEHIAFRDIIDGLSNTIAVVEVATEAAVPWTAPQGYEVASESTGAGLRNIGGKVTVALMDGSVQNLDFDLPDATWKALFSRNGGEIVDLR